MEIPYINRFLDQVNCLNKTIEVKCLKPMAKFDNLVTQNLRDGQIITRPAGSNGLWCFILLPTVLILYSHLYEPPLGYKLAACIAAGLLFYNILLNLFLYVSSLILKIGTGGNCFIAGLISSLLVYNVITQDMLFVAVFVLPSPWIFKILLQKLLTYPKTFTIGEAVIVAQSIVIATIVMLAEMTYGLCEEQKEVDVVNAVVFTVFSTVGLIVTALYLLKKEFKTVKMLTSIMIAAAALAVIQLYWILGFNCIAMILMFLFMDKTRVTLIAFWIFLLFLAVAVLVIRTKMEGKATTATRKVFHVLAAAVFASGILYDLKLIEMAAGIGFGLLILIEAIRKSNIEPISPALQSAFLVYSDEKDCGSFALTPIYMYCGLSCGLLAPRDAAALERLAGVLAVGVGDAAASWFGARYGQHKWNGQNRTMEGTVFNILSQIMTVYCFGLFELMDCKNAVIRTAVAATASSLVESKTDQVDNLILPLITLIAFQFMYFMS